MFGSKAKRAVTVELPKPKQKAVAYALDHQTTGYLKCGNGQTKGDRSDQQDSFGYSNIASPEFVAQNGIAAVLADGMGGLSFGRQISEYTIREVMAGILAIDKSGNIPTQLEILAESVNSSVCATLDNSNGSGGTTLAAIFIYGRQLFWLAIGDSRIYLQRGRALYQLNEDHDYLNQLLSEYIFDGCSLEAARTDPQKDALTSFVGNPKLPCIDLNRRPFHIEPNDKVLLCSDGVYNALSHDELLEQLRDEPQLAADKMIKLIQHRKIAGQDNSTAMVIEIRY